MKKPRSGEARQARWHAGTRARRAEFAALLGVLALVSAATGQTLDCATFSRGGAIIPPSGSTYTHVIVLGQPIPGLAGALMPNDTPGPSYSLKLTFGAGFIPCLRKPTMDLSTVLIEWVGADDNYNDPLNWTPQVVPDNNALARYQVLVRPRINDATPTITLDRTPSIARLTVEAGATIEVNADSQSDRAILFSGYGGAFGAVNATSQGLIQVNATNTISNDLLLSDIHLDQTGGGILRASGTPTATGTLRLISCRIVGGTIAGTEHGRVELYDSIVVSPVVQGPGGVSILPLANNPETTVQGTVTNASQIRVESGADLVATSTNASFTGSGRIVLVDEGSSTLGGLEGLLTNGVAPGAAHRVEGAGLIAGRLLNNGIVEANVPGDELDVDVSANVPPVPGYGRSVVNAHVMRATAGGMLRISSAIHNLGQIVAEHGGTVVVNGVVDGTGTLFLGGGAFFIDVVSGPMSCGDIDVRPGSTSTFTVTGSTVACDDLTVAGGTATLQRRVATPTAVTAAGALTICPDTATDPAAVAVVVVDGSTLAAGSVDICVGPNGNEPGGGELHAVNGGWVTCAGDFSFDAVEEDDISWAALTALGLNGGVGLPNGNPTAYATLEVGGQDFGTDPGGHVGAPAGYVSNFQIEELIIGPDGHVKLVDAHDNGNRIENGFGDQEALYVKKLTFADGQGRLNLNFSHLYYQELSPPGAESQIVAGVPADANCDGVVDFFDIDPFLLLLFNPAQHAVQYPGCNVRSGDVDGNGGIDFFDIDPFLMELFN